MEERIVPIEKAAAPVSLFDFGANLGQAWKFADMLSKSQIIPDTFKNNTAACLIALDMANRMRRNPLEIMQAMYIVHGKPSFSSSFLISLINSCGYYEPLRFEFKGEEEGRSCMAWTIDKRTGDRVEGPIISIQMAKEEGWYGKNGSKWKTMPEVMLRYRAAAFFSRAYCPDLTGGFHSVEEVKDAGREEIAPQQGPAVDLKAELLAQGKEPKQPLAPIDENMAQVKEPAANDLRLTEERRTKLIDMLTIDLTAEEAEAWCVQHYGKEMRKMDIGELGAAIKKRTAETAGRM